MRSFIPIIFCLTLLGCSRKKKPIVGKSEFQISLNSEFKDASKSPLKQEDLKVFNGLQFFPIDSGYIVEATLLRTPDSDWFLMNTNTNRKSEERVYGILTFNLKGEQFKLNIYQGAESLETEGQEDYLFLPFLDETNGNETYGGGRYLDCTIPEGDKISIDFNKAYNPYCAYNEKFSCPIVPRDNYLNIKVEAGVMSWKD